MILFTAQGDVKFMMMLRVVFWRLVDLSSAQ